MSRGRAEPVDPSQRPRSRPLEITTDPATAADRLSKARRREPDRPVILVVRGELPSRARQRLIAAGAAAVIPAAEADEMLDAARVLCAAGYLVVAPGARPSGAALSAREKQVLALVALGLSNAEIANELVVSEHTVKSHVSAALAKLGARSRSEAAQLVLDPDSGVGAGVLRITPQAQGDDQGAAGEGDASGAWLRT